MLLLWDGPRAGVETRRFDRKSVGPTKPLRNGPFEGSAPGIYIACLIWVKKAKFKFSSNLVAQGVRIFDILCALPGEKVRRTVSWANERESWRFWVRLSGRLPCATLSLHGR